MAHQHVFGAKSLTKFVFVGGSKGVSCMKFGKLTPFLRVFQNKTSNFIVLHFSAISFTQSWTGLSPRGALIVCHSYFQLYAIILQVQYNSNGRFAFCFAPCKCNKKKHEIPQYQSWAQIWINAYTKKLIIRSPSPCWVRLLHLHVFKAFLLRICHAFQLTGDVSHTSMVGPGMDTLVFLRILKGIQWTSLSARQTKE